MHYIAYYNLDQLKDKTKQSTIKKELVHPLVHWLLILSQDITTKIMLSIL